jgi:hypothetical protein
MFGSLPVLVDRNQEFAKCDMSPAHLLLFPSFPCIFPSLLFRPSSRTSGRTAQRPPRLRYRPPHLDRPVRRRLELRLPTAPHRAVWPNSCCSLPHFLSLLPLPLPLPLLLSSSLPFISSSLSIFLSFFSSSSFSSSLSLPRSLLPSLVSYLSLFTLYTLFSLSILSLPPPLPSLSPPVSQPCTPRLATPSDQSWPPLDPAARALDHDAW